MRYFVSCPDKLGFEGFYIPSYLVGKYIAEGYVVKGENDDT